MENRKQITSTGRKAFAKRFEGARSGPGASSSPLRRTIESLLLFDTAGDQLRGNRNASNRELDQSWRVDGQSPGADAILYGIPRHQNGDAKTLAASPQIPTRLWLGAQGALPSDRGATFPDGAGTLNQETHVRVFLPVTDRK